MAQKKRTSLYLSESDEEKLLFIMGYYNLDRTKAIELMVRIIYGSIRAFKSGFYMDEDGGVRELTSKKRKIMLF